METKFIGQLPWKATTETLSDKTLEIAPISQETVLKQNLASELPAGATEGQKMMARMLGTRDGEIVAFVLEPKDEVNSKEKDEPVDMTEYYGGIVAGGEPEPNTPPKVITPSSPEYFYENALVVLREAVVIDDKQKYVAANKSGIYLLESNHELIPTEVAMGAILKKVEIANGDFRTQVESSDLPNLRKQPLTGSSIDSVAGEAIRKADVKEEIVVKKEEGITREEKLSVLKMYESRIPVDKAASIEFLSEARGYNSFSKKDAQLVELIDKIKSQVDGEDDQLKKYSAEIQLKMCQVFQEERQKLMPDLRRGENWRRYLKDLRALLNRGEVKFRVSDGYKKEFQEKRQKASEKVLQILESKDYSVDALEDAIIAHNVAAAIEGYLNVAKYDKSLKPITS